MPCDSLARLSNFNLMLYDSVIVRDYLQRLVPLLEDGYAVRHSYESESLYVSRLRHMSNGNTIVLTADLNRRQLSQKTNNVQTFFRQY